MVGTRLITWAPSQSPSTSYLPTLDPDGLYAASILQAKGVSEYSISAPSSLLHSRVPCLEETATGVILAQEIDDIQRYARKHSDFGPSLLDDEEGDIDIDISVDNRTRRRRWAQRKALERHILSTLHPLLYQVLFSRELYSHHTAKVYQSGLSVLNRGSLIGRLRSEMRQHFAMKAKAMENSRDTELCAILAESNAARYIREEEDRERQDLADRGGIARDGKKRSTLGGVRGDGLLQEEKASAAKAFSEMRLRTYASKLFDGLTEILGSDDFFHGSDKPSQVDLRLFSLLAPMLLPISHHSKLAASSIPSLLRSTYPALIKHTERIQKLIWPIEVQPLLEARTGRGGEIVQRQFVSTPGWPEIEGRQDEFGDEGSDPLTIRLASGLGRLCGQTYYYSSSILSTLKDRTREEPKQETKTEVKKPVMTQAEKSEARRVAIGRWIWISSAVVGLIGTAFTSGLLSISLVGDEDDDEAEAGEREIVELVQAQLESKGPVKAEEEEGREDANEVDDEEEYEIVVVDDEELDEEAEASEEIELDEDEDDEDDE